MIGVLSNEQRHEQMALAIGRFPMLRKCKQRSSGKRVSIACYGPSILNTYKLLRRPIISVSGAHDFLVERGIVPDYHVECDPREHKALMLRHPQPETVYLMATVCHPSWWDKLQGMHVLLWHLVNGDDFETVEWVANHHPEGMNCLIGGGSTVGQRAMNVAASALGYRRFNIHGMDCSYTVNRHAAPHTGPYQPPIYVQAGSRKFQTTRQMAQAAVEMEKFLMEMDADVAFYGDGLMQEMAKIIRQRRSVA